MDIRYIESIELIKYVLSDIDVIKYYTNDYIAKTNKCYENFDLHYKFNDEIIRVYFFDIQKKTFDVFSEANTIGTNYVVYLKNGKKKEKDMKKVFDVKIIDKNVLKPSIEIDTYRKGYWEDYLHEVAEDYKKSLNPVEDIKEKSLIKK